MNRFFKWIFNKLVLLSCAAAWLARLLEDFGHAVFLQSDVLVSNPPFANTLATSLKFDTDLHFLSVFLLVILLSQLTNSQTSFISFRLWKRLIFPAASLSISIVLLSTAFFSLGKSTAYILWSAGATHIAEQLFHVATFYDEDAVPLSARCRRPDKMTIKSIEDRTKVVSCVYGQESTQSASLQRAIAQYYVSQGGYEQAKLRYLQALDLNRKANSSYSCAQILERLAEICVFEKQISRARDFATASFLILLKTENSSLTDSLVYRLKNLDAEVGLKLQSSALSQLWENSKKVVLAKRQEPLRLYYVPVFYVLSTCISLLFAQKKIAFFK